MLRTVYKVYTDSPPKLRNPFVCFSTELNFTLLPGVSVIEINLHTFLYKQRELYCRLYLIISIKAFSIILYTLQRNSILVNYAKCARIYR